MCTIVELVVVRCVAIAIASRRNYRRRAPRFERGCGTVLGANCDATGNLNTCRKVFTLCSHMYPALALSESLKPGLQSGQAQQELEQSNQTR